MFSPCQCVCACQTPCFLRFEVLLCVFHVFHVFFFPFCPLVFSFLEGFWVCGRVCGDRSVFVTSHRPAHTSRAHVISLIELCISHLKCFLFAHLPPRAPPCLWIFLFFFLFPFSFFLFFFFSFFFFPFFLYSFLFFSFFFFLFLFLFLFLSSSSSSSSFLFKFVFL